MIDHEKNKIKRTYRQAANYSLYVLIPVILILLGWSMVRQQKQLIRVNELNQDKNSLVKELGNLKDDYQTIKSLNEEYEGQITQDQNRIDRMIREIRHKSNNIEEYRAEVSELQVKLVSYLSRIDSLENTLEEKDQLSMEVISRLKTSRDSLFNLIQKSSKLSAYNVDIRTLNIRDRTTRHPGRVDHVDICLTLGANVFVESGRRNIYLRILRPDEKLIYDSEEDLFRANDQELAYTGKVSINYENAKTRVCITWKNIDEELEEGLYYVNLYTDGYEIGSRAFLLEKKFLFL